MSGLTACVLVIKQGVEVDRKKEKYDEVFKESINIADDILEQLYDSEDLFEDEYKTNYLDQSDMKEKENEDMQDGDNDQDHYQSSMFYCTEGCFQIDNDTTT